MTVTISSISNTQSIGVIVDRVNQIAQTVTTNVVTTSMTATPAPAAGNAFITGIFGANILYASIVAGGNVTSNGNLIVASNTSMRGSLSVNTTFSVQNAATFYASANIVGNAYLYSSLSTNGSATFANTISVTGAANVLSTLGVTGAANLLSTLGVTGDANLAGNINVSGAGNIAGALYVGGATNVNNNLTVNGTITTTNTVDVVTSANATVTVGNGSVFAYVNSTTVAATNVNANLIAGTLTTVSQPNIIANNSLNLGGQPNTYYINLSTAAYTNAVAFANGVANNAYANAVAQIAAAAATAYSNATSYADSKAATAYSNATTFASNASNLSTGTVSPSVVTGNYGNITAVGTLTTLTVSGSGSYGNNLTVSNTINIVSTANVGGDLNLSGNLNITGYISNVKASSLTANGIANFTAGLYSVSGTSLQTVDTYATATYRAADYFLQLTDTNTGSYHATKITVVHDGVNPYITEYSTIAPTGSLGTFTADINSGNLRLRVTPATGNVVVKYSRTTIVV